MAVEFTFAPGFRFAQLAFRQLAVATRHDIEQHSRADPLGHLKCLDWLLLRDQQRDHFFVGRDTRFEERFCLHFGASYLGAQGLDGADRLLK